MLGMVVYTIGRQAETYIAHHIDHLVPGRTVVCSLSPCENPRWAPASRVMELYRSQLRPVQCFRKALWFATPAALRTFDFGRLAFWLSSNRIQVVFCEYLPVALTVADMCHRMGIPLVAHAHGYDVAAQPHVEGWADKYRKELPRLQDLVVVSEAMRRRVVEFGVEPARVHVIPCGTQVDTTRPPRVHGAKDRYKVLAVGRLIGKKGPIYLLEAFRLIRERGIDAELLVVGDGPFREPMRQFIASTGLEGHVRLAGELPNQEVRRRLSETDLFLQHSVRAEDGDEEGLPVSVLEAMAESVPVVSTRHAGIPEAVDDERNGFLVEPGDSREMAERGLQLLRDADLRTRFGAAGRETVLSRFSQERELSQLRSVLARHCPAWN